MDIVFVQDATESQQEYIEATRNSIVEICYFLEATKRVAPGGLRLGLIAFRDYSDDSVIHNYGFTTDLNKLKEDLTALRAYGGGDGPEAVEAALHEVSKTKWAEGSVRIVVLITDAPPHRLGERGDSRVHMEKAKEYDPLQIARLLAEDGVVVFIMACEPGLSRYRWAVDFYSSLAKITSGALYSVTQPGLLASCIIGSALEALEIRALSLQHQAEIAKRFFELKEPIEKIVDAVMDKLGSGQQKVTRVNVATIYRDTLEARRNLQALLLATTVGEAKLRPMIGARCIPGYLSCKEELAEGPISAEYATINVSNSGKEPIDFEIWNPSSAPDLNPGRSEELAISFLNTLDSHIEVEVQDSKFEAKDQFITKAVFLPSAKLQLPVPEKTPRNFIMRCGREIKYFCRTFLEATTLDLGQLWHGSR